MKKQYFVYITTNKSNQVLYTGVTSNLIKRIYEHKNKLVFGFTSKYTVNKLVFYEEYSSAIDAITREKQIKAGSRKKKLDLIRSINHEFNDLYTQIVK